MVLAESAVVKQQVALLVGILILVAVWAATLTPQPDARDRRVARVYAAVLEKVISSAPDPKKIDRLFLFKFTEPTVLSDQALAEVKPQPETASDFAAQNRKVRAIHPLLNLSRPVEWLAPGQSAAQGNLPLAFSDVGFNASRTEALVSLSLAQVREDFVLAKAAKGEWKVARVSSPQPL